MKDIFVIFGFFSMIMAPCVVALHASLGEEGPELGYAATMRRLRSSLVETFRI